MDQQWILCLENKKPVPISFASDTYKEEQHSSSITQNFFSASFNLSPRFGKMGFIHLYFGGGCGCFRKSWVLLLYQYTKVEISSTSIIEASLLHDVFFFFRCLSSIRWAETTEGCTSVWSGDKNRTMWLWPVASSSWEVSLPSSPYLAILIFLIILSSEQQW